MPLRLSRCLPLPLPLARAPAPEQVRAYVLNARNLVPRQRTAFERARAHAATLLRDQERTSVTGISKAPPLPGR